MGKRKSISKRATKKITALLALALFLPFSTLHADERLWEDITAEWRILLTQIKTTQEHAKFVREKNIVFHARPLAEGTIAAWRANEGVPQFMHNGGKHGHGDSPDDVFAAPAILSQFRGIKQDIALNNHGMTHFEFKDKFGFEFLYPVDWNEALSAIDELRLWRDPQFRSLYESVKDDDLARDANKGCDDLDKAWRHEGPDGILKHLLSNEKIYEKALRSGCSQVDSVRLIAAVMADAQAVLEKTTAFRKNLVAAQNEEQKLEAYLTYVKEMIKDEAKRRAYEQRAVYAGHPDEKMADKSIQDQEMRLKRLKETFAVVNDPLRYGQMQGFYADKMKELDSIWEKEKKSAQEE